MNIALFVKDYASGEDFSKDGVPVKSGAEFHAENHAKQLVRQGHSVTIFAKKRHYYTKARENIDGIDVVRLHEPFRGLEIILRLLTTHRSMQAVYIIGIPKFAAWAVLMAHLLKIPVTMALTRRDEIFDRQHGWRNRIFSTCTSYIAISHEIQRGLLQSGKIEKDKIFVLSQGIDCSRYQKVSAEQKMALRKQYNIPADARVLLFCARVVPVKGIDLVQRIWPRIHKAYSDARLLIVGGGLNSIMTELKSMSEENDGTVTVVGEVPNPQIYYQMADVYILPSHQEGLPTTLMEAMASGCPGVVTDIGGCEDLIQADISGYKFPIDDDDDFFEKTLLLLKNAELCDNMGKAAGHFVQQKCDYPYIIPKLERIIFNALQETRDFLRKN